MSKSKNTLTYEELNIQLLNAIELHSKGVFSEDDFKKIVLEIEKQMLLIKNEKANEKQQNEWLNFFKK